MRRSYFRVNAYELADQVHQRANNLGNPSCKNCEVTSFGKAPSSPKPQRLETLVSVPVALPRTLHSDCQV